MDMILKGDICYSVSPSELFTKKDGYLICRDDTVCGVFNDIPDAFKNYPILNYENKIIIPGLCDLHTHAPQYSYRGLGMSLELLEWLKTYTYPEESKYIQPEYAEKMYRDFTDALIRSATTRVSIFATAHLPATMTLMEMLESSGMASYVGLVSMDRNCPEALKAGSAKQAYETLSKWVEMSLDKFTNTKPILTPRFIPTCSDELMNTLATMQRKYDLPLQSHMSENVDEIKWVKELLPGVKSYASGYNQFGLFGDSGNPTVMAHCIWCEDEDIELLKKNNVYIAHCPGSNMNIASGIAPIRKYISLGLSVGLGSDVAGSTHLSMFRAISDAVQVSKMYWRIIDETCKPLTFSEAFYLATAGGGSFFGNIGSFDEGYQFDAVVLDESSISTIHQPNIAERLERLIYIGDESCISSKYVKGQKII